MSLHSSASIAANSVGGGSNMSTYLSRQNFHHFFDSLARLVDCSLSLSFDLGGGPS
jgi:hypothetical protein